MRAVGIIMAGGKSGNLGELTEKRAVAAMPVGSCYRAIDFAMSNMSNSGIGKIAVITQYNSRSLLDHLSSSKWWDLGRKKGGLFVFTPYLTSDNSFWYKGTADAIYQNISYLKRSNEQYVVISSGDHVYKMNYRDVIGYHVKKGADITFVCRDVNESIVKNFGVATLDKNNKLLEFEEKPLEPQSNTISLGIYVMQRTLLINLLETIVKEGRNDFVNDIIIRYRKKLNIYGYEFNEYWRNINSIESYFETNMDFLERDVRNKFWREYPYIATKVKDEPPTKYNSDCNINDSLIGGGSILNGYIEKSILYRKVYTGNNSSIKNSIIMEGTYIGNNCELEYVILDKEVVISDGKKLIGTKESPIILGKGTVV